MDSQQATTATNQAIQNGQQLQSQYNSQVPGLQSNYGNAQNQANNAYGNLQNYVSTMQSPMSMYNQQLTNAQNMYGFNPNSLLTANKALANTNTTLANLPQAIQQQGNYYGTTAGAEAQNYGNQAGNLNAVQQGQINAVNAYQNILAATQNQANQAATLGLGGEQAQITGLSNLYQNAVGQMQQAGTVMAQIEQLAQTQGTATAAQIASYNAAAQSYTQAQLNAQQYSNTANLQTQFQSLYGPNWATAMADYQSKTAIPQSLLASNTPKATTGYNPSQIQDSWNTGSNSSVLNGLPKPALTVTKQPPKV